MHQAGGRRRGRIRQTISFAIVAMTMGACGSGRTDHAASAATLSIGVAQLSSTSPIAGLRQLSPLLVLEGLARAGDDGRMQPWLADSWASNDQGRAIVVQLKRGIKFQDGSPFDAVEAARILPDILRSFMGPVFDDVAGVKAGEANTITIELRRPSPFAMEALEASIRKPGGSTVGTGPFMVEGDSTTELHANNSYYLGPPAINRVTVANYPSVRTAWAEMLRDRLDMLWEVGIDALDSMKDSSTISLFTYTRHYQHIMVFNTSAPPLRSAAVRRALNLAIDRTGVVREALRGYGVPSTGPLNPRYWALAGKLVRPLFDPEQVAAALPKEAVRFTCLVAPDSVDERLALEVKRQLAAVGVEMTVQEAARDEIVRRGASRQYEAAITEVISGPTAFRPYLIWHSEGPLNWGHFGTPALDVAFDRIRRAPDEQEFRSAVDSLQQVFIDDPPAILLAWSVRARAISKRFDVQAEEGRDVLSTVRFWKPSTVQRQASRN